MRKSPIKRRGKHARGKKLNDITPYLAERAGGYWLGWHTNGAHSVGCQCEICGAHIGDVMGNRAHIRERKSEADDTIWNLIIACPGCHNHDDYPDGGLVCGTEAALAIVKQRNAECGITEDE